MKTKRNIQRSTGNKNEHISTKFMEIIIPIKPISINEAFQGRRFKTKKCKDFEKSFLDIAPKKKMITGLIEIQYEFYVKNHKQADYDNLIKITQDLLKVCGYIEDDRKIYKATVYKIPSDDERIEVKIEPLTKNHPML